MGTYGTAPNEPILQVCSTGMYFPPCVATLSRYSLYWFCKTHDEVKHHAKTGLGGGVGLVLGLFVTIVKYFLTPSEVKDVYKRRGTQADDPRGDARSASPSIRIRATQL